MSKTKLPTYDVILRLTYRPANQYYPLGTYKRMRFHKKEDALSIYNVLMEQAKHMNYFEIILEVSGGIEQSYVNPHWEMREEATL